MIAGIAAFVAEAKDGLPAGRPAASHIQGPANGAVACSRYDDLDARLRHENPPVLRFTLTPIIAALVAAGLYGDGFAAEPVPVEPVTVELWPNGTPMTCGLSPPRKISANGRGRGDRGAATARRN